MDLTIRNFVIVMAAAGGIIAGSALSNADSQSAAQQDAIENSRTESFVYLPSQFKPDAAAMPTEHIQAY